MIETAALYSSDQWGISLVKKWHSTTSCTISHRSSRLSFLLWSVPVDQFSSLFWYSCSIRPANCMRMKSVAVDLSVGPSISEHRAAYWELCLWPSSWFPIHHQHYPEVSLTISYHNQSFTGFTAITTGLVCSSGPVTNWSVILQSIIWMETAFTPTISAPCARLVWSNYAVSYGMTHYATSGQACHCRHL